MTKMVCGGIRTRIDLRSRLVEQSPSPFDHRYVTDCEALAFKYTNALASTVCSWKYSLRSHTGKLLFRDTTNGRSTRQTNGPLGNFQAGFWRVVLAGYLRVFGGFSLAGFWRWITSKTRQKPAVTLKKLKGPLLHFKLFIRVFGGS